MNVSQYILNDKLTRDAIASVSLFASVEETLVAAGLPISKMKENAKPRRHESLRDATVNGDFSYVVDPDGCARILSCASDESIVVIPERIDGYPVTAIGDHAFSTHYSLQRIELPAGIVSIERYAFMNTALEEFSGPPSLVFIGENAFYKCTKLRHVTLNGEGGLLQNLAVANRKPANYAKFLRRFATMAEDLRVSDEDFDYAYYTYGLSRYGNVPLVEPLENQEAKHACEFVIALDTSGSCSGELVRAFVERTFDTLRQQTSFGDRMNVHLVQCANACILAGTGEGDEAFLTIHQEFRGFAGAFEAEVGNLRKKLENVYAFLEDAFDEEREALLFTTELAARKSTALFVTRYGCEGFARHNEELQFSEKRTDLLKRIETAQKPQNDAGGLAQGDALADQFHDDAPSCHPKRAKRAEGLISLRRTTVMRNHNDCYNNHGTQEGDIARMEADL